MRRSRGKRCVLERRVRKLLFARCEGRRRRMWKRTSNFVPRANRNASMSRLAGVVSRRRLASSHEAEAHDGRERREGPEHEEGAAEEVVARNERHRASLALDAVV